MLRILFIFASLLWVACSVDLPAPLSPSGKRTSESLVAVASDSLYCRDAAFWRAYCDRWDLALGGCEAIDTCEDGDTTGVALIVSDTAWVSSNPSAHGWLRVPQKYPAARRQRWTHPHYANLGEFSQYDAPAPPSSIGLVAYPFRASGSAYTRTLYGLPCNCEVSSVSQGSTPKPPPQPQEPEEEETTPEEKPDLILNASLGGSFTHLLWQPAIDEPLVHSIVGDLPDGLSFDEERLAITGTPTQVGSTDFVHLLTSENGGEYYVRGRLRIVVFPDFPDFSFAGTKTGVVGQPLILSVPGLDLEEGASCSMIGLPDGVSFDSSTKETSGSPLFEGRYEMAFIVTNADGTVDTDLSFRELIIVQSESKPSEMMEDDDESQPDFDREIKGYVGEYLFWTLWRPHLDSGDPRPLAHRIDGDLPPGISLQIEENDENPEDKIPHLQGTFEEAGVWFVHHWVEDAEEEVIYHTLYRISVSSEPEPEPKPLPDPELALDLLTAAEREAFQTEGVGLTFNQEFEEFAVGGTYEFVDPSLLEGKYVGLPEEATVTSDGGGTLTFTSSREGTFAFFHILYDDNNEIRFVVRWIFEVSG